MTILSIQIRGLVVRVELATTYVYHLRLSSSLAKSHESKFFSLHAAPDLMSSAANRVCVSANTLVMIPFEEYIRPAHYSDAKQLSCVAAIPLTTVTLNLIMIQHQSIDVFVMYSSSLSVPLTAGPLWPGPFLFRRWAGRHVKARNEGLFVQIS